MKKTTVAELKKFLKAEAKRLQSDWEDVPEWMIHSAVKFFNKKQPNKQEKIEEEIGRFVSHDWEDYALIAKALKKALKTKPDAMLESINYKRGESITPIERLEFTYTVKDFCALVGIE